MGYKCIIIVCTILFVRFGFLQIIISEFINTVVDVLTMLEFNVEIFINYIEIHAPIIRAVYMLLLSMYYIVRFILMTHFPPRIARFRKVDER